MNTLICPISIEKVNKSLVRITGFLVAVTVILYVASGNVLFMGLLLIDFIIRGFTRIKYSPYSYLAKIVAARLHLIPKPIDKAPKLFAARVGFIFTLVSLATYFVNPTVSVGIALILMAFALLESVLNFCVGCVVYTYIILPLNNRQGNE